MPTIIGTSGNDLLLGTGPDSSGVGGNDLIEGLAGNDTINGSGGTDTLRGGEGDDVFLFSEFGVSFISVDGGAGSDTLDFSAASVSIVGGGNSFQLISNPAVVLGQFFNIERFLGSSVRDMFELRGDSNTPLQLFGNAGNDYLGAMLGSDVFASGGSGDDTIQVLGATGAVRIFGDDGNDILYASGPSRQTELSGGQGNDTISVQPGGLAFGDEGNDAIIVLPNYGTESLATVLHGGVGIDTLEYKNNFSGIFDLALGQATLEQPTFYRAGSSVTFTGIENVTLDGGQLLGDANANTLSNQGLRPILIRGRGGDDTISSGGADDALYGDDGADRLISYNGDDSLYGGNGNDVLSDESGRNLIDGGGGIDTVVFNYSIAIAGFGYSPGAIVISGPAGSDRITGVERFQFTDRTVELNDGAPAVDDLFYLLTYRDIGASTLDADFHYNQQGWREGRDPNVFFDTSAYLSANRDIANAGINPLAHFLAAGWREGRDPAWFFDNEQYLADNPDAVGSGMSPLEHALAIGLYEGRLVRPAIGAVNDVGFDAQYYLLRNEDVGRSGADPYAHFLAVGWREGRDPNAYFDTAYYLSKNPDVAAAGINPLLHYMQAGWREGRDPSAQFDTSSYLGANPDVAAAGINPLLHYLIAGRLEGRGFGADSPAAAPAAAEVPSWEAAPAESDLLSGLATLLGAQDDGSSQPYVMVDAADAAGADQLGFSSDGIDTLV